MFKRGPQIVTAPAAEPVTASEAKAHLRVDHSNDDTYIGTIITAARRMLENHCQAQFVSATYDWALDSFASYVKVPRPPLVSVTSITYLDSTGASQTLDSSVYRVDTRIRPGRIWLGYGQMWPSVYDVAAPITVRYVAGFGDASAVPQEIKQAVLLVVGHLYENREQVIVDSTAMEIPLGIRALLSEHCFEEYA